MNLFSFISPRTIGVSFFELDEKDGNNGDDNYWNYDMREISGKIYDIIKDKDTQQKLSVPISNMAAMCILLSRSSKEVSITISEEQKETSDAEKLANFSKIDENFDAKVDDNLPTETNLDSDIPLLGNSVSPPTIDFDESDNYLPLEQESADLKEERFEELTENEQRIENEKEKPKENYDWLMKSEPETVKGKIEVLPIEKLEGAYGFLNDYNQDKNEDYETMPEQNLEQNLDELPGNNLMGGGLENVEIPTVNIRNFDYFTSSYNSSEILKNTTKSLIDIYIDSKTYLIPEFLLYMCKSDDSKYKVIIDLFRNDDNFMDALDSDMELYKILSNMNVEKEIKELQEEDEDEEVDEEIQQEKFEITGYAEDKCKEEESKLNNLIKHGGPFTKQDALYLEYCKGRKKKKTLKKENKT